MFHVKHLTDCEDPFSFHRLHLTRAHSRSTSLPPAAANGETKGETVAHSPRYRAGGVGGPPGFVGLRTVLDCSTWNKKSKELSAEIAWANHGDGPTLIHLIDLRRCSTWNTIVEHHRSFLGEPNGVGEAERAVFDGQALSPRECSTWNISIVIG